MIGNCKDCKHWGKDESIGERFCVLTRRDAVGRLLHPETLAWCDSGDPYCGLRLVTSPDFGCVQFEPKGDATP